MLPTFSEVKKTYIKQIGRLIKNWNKSFSDANEIHLLSDAITYISSAFSEVNEIIQILFSDANKNLLL